MTPQKHYFRIMLGKGSLYAEECHKGNFIGTDFLPDIDLTHKLPDDWQKFNRQFIPIYQQKNPGKSKIAAGLACGALHTITKSSNKGDIVLCPDGKGSYLVGEIVSDYSYHPDQNLPHRRSVSWSPHTIQRTDMSPALQNSTGSAGTVANITQYSAEIEQLLAGNALPPLVATDKTVEDPATFALEKHLEEFLVQNWKHTALGQKYDIYIEDGALVGRQYPSDTGPIDILAISKDKKELLIVELKKGRASDVVVGQIQRYMGYVTEELAEEGQTVKGVIIALEKDLRLQRALRVTQNIEFYRYEVSFKLHKE